MDLGIECKDGSKYVIGPQLADSYKKIYLDVEREFALMTIWLENHKSRRPSNEAGARRFVSTWLSKAKKAPVLSPVKTAQTATIHALTGGGRGITIEG